MSPSSRGLVPGLFLALAAALGVLGANAHWLFPAQGETGVRYFVSAPGLARGDAPLTPWSTAAGEAPEDALAGRGRLMPALMAGLIRQGARAHVSALWVLAASAGVAALALSWAAGGVAGLGGALAAGLVFLAAPATVDATTVLGPDALLAALAALLLGTLTYRPRGSLLHGTLAAAAWLAHPAGLGLVAVSVVWPFTRSAGDRSTRRRVGAVGAAALPSILLLGAGPLHPFLVLPGVHGGGLHALGASLGGALSFLGAGLPGALGVGVGGVLAALVAGLVVAEARGTPPPPEGVHWSDPAAPDALARSFRPAAGLVALGAVLGAAAAGTGEDLSTPWFAAAVPLAALAGAAVVRWKRRHAGLRGWLPVACLLVWIALSGMGSWWELTRLRASGRGYTSAHWVASPLIRWIDNRSRPYPILYADQPALVFLQTGRVSREIRLGQGTLDDFASAFRAEPGAVVLTGSARAQADAVAERLGLRVLVDDPWGRILAP